jgi:hypothetical protein
MFNTTINDTPSTTEIVPNTEMLVLLEQQMNNFPLIRGYVNNKNLTPSVIFLPQTLKEISENNNLDLFLECLNMLDMVKFYSGVLYSDTEYFTNKVINVITDNRTVENINYCINKDMYDDFIFSTKEDAKGFILNNKALIAIYLYSLLSLIFFKQ